MRRPDDRANFTMMEKPVPEITDDEVLVRMRAVGVGIHDGWAFPSNPHFPYAIGLEGAGVIAEVGTAVTDVAVGDRVMFSGMPQRKGGTWAEFAAVSGDTLTAMPDDLDFIEAAALPISGTAALEGLLALDLSRGDTVFMAGASGSIGSLAVQLATLREFRVAASASSMNREYLRALGAEVAVDYRDPDWAAQVLDWSPDGVDAALAIQPGTATTSLQVVRDGGKIVTISGDQVAAERHITIQQVAHHPETRAALARLAADVATGRVRVVIDQAHPFDRAPEALEKTRQRHARGKIVLVVENCSPARGG